MPGKRWTKQEMERLTEFYTNREGERSMLASEIGRTENSIAKKAGRLKLPGLERFRLHELEFLKKNYRRLTIREMASELERSEDSIGHKLSEMGLKKTRQELSAVLKRRDYIAPRGEQSPLWSGGKPHCKCTICGSEFIGEYGNPNIFCSLECMGRWHSINMRGKNHPNWKGGASLQQRYARQLVEYKEWRLAVFKRDDYTCQKCGERKGRIEAHHIKSFSKYPELATQLDNGLTLCYHCHREYHRGKREKKGGY